MNQQLEKTKVKQQLQPTRIARFRGKPRFKRLPVKPLEKTAGSAAAGLAAAAAESTIVIGQTDKQRKHPSVPKLQQHRLKSRSKSNAKALPALRMMTKPDPEPVQQKKQHSLVKNRKHTALNLKKQQSVSAPSHQILKDLLAVFSASRARVMRTRDLISDLQQFSAAYLNLNPKSLARMLSPYGIRPCGHWYEIEGSAGKQSAKSYLLKSIKKAYRLVN